MLKSVKCLSTICRIMLIGIVSLFLFSSSVFAFQDQPLASDALVGWLNSVYGDPVPGIPLPARQLNLLTDGHGQIVAQLILDQATARQFDGQQVELVGDHLPQRNIIAGTPYLRVTSIQRVKQDQNEPESGSKIGERTFWWDVAGDQPWLIALCRFPDIPEIPHPPSWYVPLFSGEYPGLNHYWQQLSYGAINLTGTGFVSQWFTLPHPQAYYVPNGQANLTLLAQECSAVMDASVYFPQYVGINFMFNWELDCCAWGGGVTLTRDGQTKSYRSTWMPYTTHSHDFLAHEMGHGFGFPHSSGPAAVERGGSGTYSSQWDMMSAGAGTCLVYDLDYGCLATGTIAYHLDLDGWLPINRRVFVWPGEMKTVTLAQLRLPQSATNALMIKVPINGSLEHFYTIEARIFSGYDQNVPGSSAIIHHVDTARNDGNLALVVDAADGNDDVNDAGAMWLPGETYTDSIANISVQILSSTASSFTVRVTNNSSQTFPPEAPGQPFVSGTTFSSITLMWEDNSYNEDGYKIYKWAYNETTQQWEFLYYAGVGANQTTFTDQSLDCGEPAFYEIASYNSYGESPRSYATTYTTSRPCSLPNAAPALHFFTTSAPRLTWNRVTGATQYEIQVDTTATFTEELEYTVIVPGSILSVTTSSLPAGEYYWRVRARSGSTTGLWSGVGKFTVSVNP
jgi:M6 family metalloprotease-like protein